MRNCPLLGRRLGVKVPQFDGTVLAFSCARKLCRGPRNRVDAPAVAFQPDGAPALREASQGRLGGPGGGFCGRVGASGGNAIAGVEAGARY